MEQLQIEALVENLDRVLAFTDEFLERCDCPMKAMMQIDVAVEELFVNIAHYAYPDGAGEALIRMEQTEKGAVRIVFVDHGIPYDPLAKDDPDVTLSAEERQIGGLGIYMVKKSMDRMEYRYEDGANILTIEKDL